MKDESIETPDESVEQFEDFHQIDQTDADPQSSLTADAGDQIDPRVDRRLGEEFRQIGTDGDFHGENVATENRIASEARALELFQIGTDVVIEMEMSANALPDFLEGVDMRIGRIGRLHAILHDLTFRETFSTVLSRI